MEKAMNRDVVTLAALISLGCPALAQIGNPAGMGADTRMTKPGVPAPHQTNNQDRLFAQLAAAAGVAEVEFGKMAAGMANTDAVKEFANMIVRDHTDANGKLKALADSAKIPLPDELDPDHAAARARLEKLSDVAYDVAYIKTQIIDHQKAAQLLAWEISMGEDAEMQRFAAATLPIVLDHLHRAQAIQEVLTGAAVR
jgi:putative membrane protein